MNKYTEAIQGDDVVILCDGIPMGVGEILAALRARQQAVVDGFVLVPVEPTPEMVMAFMREFYKKEKSFDTAACYRAMLAASQSATGGAT